MSRSGVTGLLDIVHVLLVAGAAPLPEEPTDGELCPADLMPQEWLRPCLAGQLLFSHSASSDDLMPEVGNGHLATVMQSDTIHAAGFFNGPAHRASATTSHRARIPRSTLWVDTIHTDFLPGCGRALDLERAAFLQRTRDPVGAPGVSVEERWYAPLHAHTTLVHELKLENPSAIEKTVHIQGTRRTESDDLIIRDVEAGRLQALQVPVSVRALEGSNKMSEVSADRTLFALAENTLPEKVFVPASSNITLRALVVIVTSLKSPDPTSDALVTLRDLMANGFAKAATLFSEHVAAWQERSEKGRIEVVGDLALAQTINASLYFLRSSVNKDWPEGLSPGGLSSDCYKGHTFWDQETWMWPPLLMLEPSAAESLLRYRLNRLPEARKKAQECGSSEQLSSFCPAGYSERVEATALMFPWESAHSGAEVQFYDGKIGQWGRYEQHISGDIALAARQYWYATKDRSWLVAHGFPLVDGIARFYAARLQARPNGTAGALYDLDQVMGPDEYQWPVKNSAYSNAVARIALEFAHSTAVELHQSGPAYDDFKRKAEGLPVLLSKDVPGRTDMKGYHPEYEGFPPKDKPMMAKQADTILLSYPLGVNVSEDILRNDLEFYEGITDPHGPAMTWSIFALAWLSIGDYTRSTMHFRRGYANAHRPYRVWSEYPQGTNFPGCVNFMTGAGGFLQSLIFGVSGMRLRETGLHFRASPTSATGTKAAGLVLHSFHYLGSRFRMEMDASMVHYELLGAEPGAQRMCLVVSGQKEVQMQLNVPRSHVLGLSATIQRCGQAGQAGVDPPATSTLTTTSSTSSTSTSSTTTSSSTTTGSSTTASASGTTTTSSSTSTTASSTSSSSSSTSSSSTSSSSTSSGTATTTISSTTTERTSTTGTTTTLASTIISTIASSIATTPMSLMTTTLAAPAVANVVVLMTVQNVDHARLTATPGLLGAFTQRITEVLADAAGHQVQPNDVSVILSPGSVAVRSTVATPDSATATDVRATLTESSRLSQDLAAGVAGVEGIGTAATGPISVRDVRVPAAAQLPPLASWWHALAAGLVICLVAFAACITLARPQKPQERSRVSSWPFNGTWVRKSDPPGGPPDARGSIIVIIDETVNWHEGKKSRILRTPERGYLITNPFYEEKSYSVELVDDELVVNGDLLFTRWQRRPTSSERTEEERGLLL